LCALSISILALGAASAFAAGALPTNGNIVAGSGAISQLASQFTINQSSQRAIINRGSFSVGSGNTVSINNGSVATLNWVTGNSTTSIAGTLTSTGSTDLFSQNGIIVIPSDRAVAGGSFVASTRDTDNAQLFQSGNLQFAGSSSGAVSNQGAIQSANSDVVLIGKSADNSGRISAPNCTAGVVAGDDVVLQHANSGLQIKLNTGSGDATNCGTVAAAQAMLNAAGGSVYALSGNNGGLISATGTANINDRVWLTARGSANVSGSV